MSSSPREGANDVLFDLPLGREEAQAVAEPAAAAHEAPAAAKPAVSERAEAPAEVQPVAAAASASIDRDPAADEWLRRQNVTLGDRLTAGGLDLAVSVSVLTIVLAVVRWMGVQVDLSRWPGFAAFLLAFSFLYFVIPLSFWGQTPGMSWAGIAARWDEDLPLSFGQSTQRWIGAILSTLLLGLPLFLGERTLADRISGTTTVPARGDG